MIRSISQGSRPQHGQHRANCADLTVPDTPRLHPNSTYAPRGAVRDAVARLACCGECRTADVSPCAPSDSTSAPRALSVCARVGMQSSPKRICNHRRMGLTANPTTRPSSRIFSRACEWKRGPPLVRVRVRAVGYESSSASRPPTRKPTRHQRRRWAQLAIGSR